MVADDPIEIPVEGPIIIVDDSEADRLIIRMVVERTSLPNDVIELKDGQSCLDYLDKVESGDAVFPALVLLDINMPGLSGFEVAAAIRERSQFAKLPVVVMVSSSTASPDKSRALELGADRYLTKELSVTTFIESFERLFISTS